MHSPGMIELLILLLGALRATLRSRADLVAENLLLRHQLAVLTRPDRKRPPLRIRDKLGGWVTDAENHHRLWFVAVENHYRLYVSGPVTQPPRSRDRAERGP